MALLKTYEEILHNPAAYKKNIYKILEDLDRRINEAKRINNSSNLYARKNHNHDTRYSLLEHKHDEYADKVHLHSQYLDKTATAENSKLLDGKPAKQYARRNHYHQNVVYVAKFRIPNLEDEGTVKVNLNFPIYVEDCYFKCRDERMEFNCVNCVENMAIIQYKYHEDDECNCGCTNNTRPRYIDAHIFYWSTEPFDNDDGLIQTNLNVNDVVGTPGETVNLYGIVKDVNYNDVRKGTVVFEKDKNEPDDDVNNSEDNSDNDNNNNNDNG